MLLQINLGVQKVASFQVDTLLQQEILIELNNSQLAFIKQRYEAFNKYGKGFEQSQRRIDDLRTLIEEATFQPIYGGEVYPGVFMDYIDFGSIADQANGSFDPANEYMFLINHKSLLWLNKCGFIPWDRDNVVPEVDPRVPTTIDPITLLPVPDPDAYELTIAANKWVQHDDIYMLLKDPFNTTERFFPLTTINDNFIEVYTDDTFIISAVRMRYIRRPLSMSVDNTTGTTTQECELPTHVHETIMDMTIDRILEGFADPRFRSHQVVTTQSE